MINKATLKEAKLFLQKHPDLEAVDLLLCDLNGILRGKRVEASSLLKVYENGVCLAESIWGSDITGETVQETGFGFHTGEPDVLLFPIANSLQFSPWQQGRIAQLQLAMCDTQTLSYQIDPRQVLIRLSEQFKKKNLQPMIALELEFYLLPRCEKNSEHLVLDPAQGSTQVYSIDDLDEHADFLRALSEAAGIQHIPVTSAVAEYAPGQFEINLIHEADAVSACDHAIELKRLIKGIAKQHGLQATFMPKPFIDFAGSGTHIHASLYDQKGKNIFYAKKDTVSEKLLFAVNGLIELMPESMLIFAPGANSYRRFVKDSYVANSANWGINNRSVAVRIPLSEPKATRIEHRVSGADSNPYLLASAIFAGMLYGLTQKTRPPAAIEGDAYEQNPRRPLPISWEQAIKSFKQSKILRSYLGDPLTNAYHAIKVEEMSKFNRQVTPLEIDWYLVNS